MSLYPDYLRTEYLKRRERNDHYSMRAFARDLGISHSYLSLIFSGKRNLSPAQAAQIALLLGYTGKELERWVTQAVQNASPTRFVNAKHQKLVNRMDHSADLTSTSQFTDLQVELSTMFAKWYHLAILDLTYLKDFQSNPTWIAKRLGINAVEARDAIDRLIALELLEVQSGKLKKAKDWMRFPTKQPHAIMRTYYQAVMAKAADSMSDQTPHGFASRWISGGTLAIKKTKIKKARERLKEFQDEFLSEFCDSSADEVYQVNLQFFSLTNPVIEKRKPV